MVTSQASDPAATLARPPAADHAGGLAALRRRGSRSRRNCSPSDLGRTWTTTSGPAMTTTGLPTTPGCWSSRPRRSARSSPQGRRLAHLNRARASGRCGLIVSGPPRTGKTTAITQLGKTIEVIHRRRYPGSRQRHPGHLHHRPPAATPRMIAAEFARFLGLPVTRRANITDIIEAVCGVCPGHPASAWSASTRSTTSTSPPAPAPRPPTPSSTSPSASRPPSSTPGISLERAGLLSGTRGEQIAGRFAMVRTGPFPRDAQWTALVAALEDSLRLHRHHPGTLTGLDGYLHQRTGGMIGSLLWLIRGAAIQAVLDGTEKITRKSLEATATDLASREARASTPAAR